MATRRSRLLLALILVVACTPLLVPAAARPSRASASVALTSTMLAGLNEIRSEHGLAQLVVNPGLTAAADAHAREMIERGYFGHDSADGRPFWRLIEVYYPVAGHSYWSVGQNLFWGAQQVNAQTALSSWMASPPHRANILQPSWRQIGIAAVSSASAPGVFGKRAVTVITTDFGVRR
jgi:uncharacterized protein YkwD